MVELTYEESGLLEPNLVFTTDVVITPNTLPFANNNPNNITGTEFDDLLVGTTRRDIISGLGGDDILRGLNSDDMLYGGPGNDTLEGGIGDDMLYGGPGNDTMNGGSGADIAAYEANRNDYTVLSYADEVAVGHQSKGGEGLDLLTGVESLRFPDQTLSAGQADGPLAYIASYADLIAAFGTDESAGFNHYLQWGYREGRSSDNFDEVQYVANYPDLQAAFGTDYEAATLHFITNGYFEGRTDKSLDYIDRATADCLFNWAETNYPGYFSPSGAVTQTYTPYTYRYYNNTNIYLGVSAIDNHVYYQIPSGERIDVGESGYWLAQANCP
jgi:hypothetical protein